MRPSKDSMEAMLVGRRFEDTDDHEFFEVRDVFWSEGEEPDDEGGRQIPEGWCVEYFPVSADDVDAEAEVEDPGRDGPGVDWSPLGWLDGAQGFARWL